MKLRWLAIAAATAALSAGPWSLAQVSDEDKDQPKSGDVQNAPKQAPAALPTADDSDIKHNGGKTDVDAVGNRNVGCGRGVGNWYTVRVRSHADASMPSRSNRKSNWLAIPSSPSM